MIDFVTRMIGMIGLTVFAVAAQDMDGAISPTADSSTRSNHVVSAQQLLAELEDDAPGSADGEKYSWPPDIGVIFPIINPDLKSDHTVSVCIVPAKEDPSLPESLEYDVLTAVKVDYKIVLVNNSPWPFVFEPFANYFGLELDFMTGSGDILTVKPEMPSSFSIMRMWKSLGPNRQWEYPISLDRRFWTFPEEFDNSQIIKVRPRFAFGAYLVDGKLFRTYDEIQARKIKERSWDDREGELVGSGLTMGRTT
ncbi:MAG: hypothetical protein IJR99_01410 [Kiritimatiellae bacterium]|nr:hypothetical protein [Kiritimatiellia bacterium]